MSPPESGDANLVVVVMPKREMGKIAMHLI